MADRHRASGDAMATVKLFKNALDKDLEKKSLDFIKFKIEKGLSKLIDILNGLPGNWCLLYLQ
jgi:DNA polymerase-3 subunit epsilon